MFMKLLVGSLNISDRKQFCNRVVVNCDFFCVPAAVIEVTEATEETDKETDEDADEEADEGPGRRNPDEELL